MKSVTFFTPIEVMILANTKTCIVNIAKKKNHGMQNTDKFL